MRMWLVNPKMLCRKHLLGEHVETHMIEASIKRGRKLDGFVANKLIDSSRLQERHDALVTEMRQRGYKHDSHMAYTDTKAIGGVDIAANVGDLRNRCAGCRTRIDAFMEDAFD